MARRKRRKVSPRTKSSPWARFFLWLFGIVALLLLIALAGGYFWLQGFMKSDRFRRLVAESIQWKLNAGVEVGPFTWQQNTVYTDQFRATGWEDAPFQRMDAERLRAELDFGALRRRKWKIPVLALDRVEILVSKESRLPRPVVVSTAPQKPPGFASWFLPNKTELDKITVDQLGLSLVQGAQNLRLQRMAIEAKPSGDETAWLVSGRSGELLYAPQKAPLPVKTISARVQPGLVTLHEASFTYEKAEVNASGEWQREPSALKLNARINGLDLERILPPDWQKRLTGQLQADLTVAGDPKLPDELIQSGQIRSGNAVLEALPVLERIAKYTGVDRFRRLVLKRSQADFTRRGQVLQCRNIILDSDGLIRLEGSLDVNGQALDGAFQVGVTADTLQWMPGARGKVFTERRAGDSAFVWTTMRVTGTLDQPKEDLSNRLLAAAGEALLVDVPVKAVETAADGAGKILDAVPGAINNPGDAVKTGVDTGIKILEEGADAIKKAGNFVPFFGN